MAPAPSQAANTVVGPLVPVINLFNGLDGHCGKRHGCAERPQFVVDSGFQRSAFSLHKCHVQSQLQNNRESGNFAFALWLPLLEPKGVGRMKSKNAKPATVLVVEDEPTVRALAESIIEDLGYTILSAANAREAIALLEQDKSIDILFTDINLPDGRNAIDGLELARKAVELCPRLRVIYTTGHGQPDGMTALFVDDATFLPKPYTVKQLTETVRATAEEHPRR